MYAQCSYIFRLQDILDPDKFWEKELMRANKDLLFSCFIDDPKGVTTLQSSVKGLLLLWTMYTSRLLYPLTGIKTSLLTLQYVIMWCPNWLQITHTPFSLLSNSAGNGSSKLEIRGVPVNGLVGGVMGRKSGAMDGSTHWKLWTTHLA
jgi:hypothetical protein